MVPVHAVRRSPRQQRAGFASRLNVPRLLHPVTPACDRESPNEQFNETLEGDVVDKYEEDFCVDAAAMTRYICETFEGLRVLEHLGDTFFIYDPAGDLPDDHWLPFATLVTDNHYDSVSELAYPEAYRINIGLTKRGYTGRLGPPPTSRDEHGVLETGFDYSVRDWVMPHPHYGSQYWVCVVNPRERTIEDVQRMLDEAYTFATRKHANRQARQATS